MYERFYRRFKIITHRKFWPNYLIQCYTDGINALTSMGFDIGLDKPGFTAVLCGTSGEITSAVFTEFILAGNSQAQIIILDIGAIQVHQSQALLAKKFPSAKISYVLADARNLPFRAATIDYYETDTLLNFFCQRDVKKVLKGWQYSLKNKGFITTRILASDHFFRKAYEEFLFLLGKIIIGAHYHTHSLNFVIQTAKTLQFNVINSGASRFGQQKKLAMTKSHRPLNR